MIKDNRMVKEHKSGLMALYMKEVGRRVNRTVRVVRFMQTATCMKAIGKTVKLMELVSLRMLMDPLTKVIGLMIKMRVGVKSHGQMGQNLKEITRMV